LSITFEKSTARFSRFFRDLAEVLVPRYEKRDGKDDGTLTRTASVASPWRRWRRRRRRRRRRLYWFWDPRKACGGHETKGRSERISLSECGKDNLVAWKARGIESDTFYERKVATTYRFECSVIACGKLLQPLSGVKSLINYAW